MKKIGDRVSRLLYMDDGTWNRNGDKCLSSSPKRHGTVINVYRKTSKVLDGPEYTDNVIDVRFDDGETKTYLHHGVDLI